MTRPAFLVPLLGAAAIATVALQVRWLRGAAEERSRAESRLAATVSMVREKERLEGERERVSASRRPEQDVIARVNSVLVGIGLDPSAFRGQQPEADARLPGAAGGEGLAYRRQSVRLSLAGLSPARLGRFLEAWRRDHPMWTPVRIDLQRRQGDGASEDAPGRYDATVVVAAIYIEPADVGGKAPEG